MTAPRSEIWFFGILLAIVAFVAWLVLAPYLSVLVLAGTLAFLFQPLYKYLLRLLRYESLSAFVSVLLVAIVIFVPVAFLGVHIFGDATSLYVSLSSHGGFDFAKEFPGLKLSTLDINSYVQQGLDWFIQHFGLFFSGFTQILFTAFLVLLGLFYFLKDGERLKKLLVSNTPLETKYAEGIVTDMEAAASSIIKGTLLVAIIQGIVMGVGLLLFHIPDPTFWGALAIPLSIIPVLGTWLVAVPAVAYLFLTGQTILAVGLAIWSILFINLIYNLLTPRFLHKGVNIHPYLILLSVLGGIGFFGPIGFLVGPLVMAFLISLLKIYPKLEFDKKRTPRL